MGNVDVETDNLCLGLNPRQMECYQELMVMPLENWPAELREFVARVAKRYGMTAEEVRRCALADWLRGTPILTRVPLT